MTATDTVSGGVPDGFVVVDLADDFVRLVGPLYVKLEADGPRVGLLLEPRHGNPLGIAHGGCLMTLADMVLGFGCGFATRTAGVHPTITLNCDFVRGARVGTWVDGKAVITRRTANFIFARCDLVSAGEVALSASGVFKVGAPPRAPG
ncbi:MAG: PaaI family thioesterase [Alphaproteobacteria bacterium]|nr:PaaI family thioesterase [Alphaproteobacteria bacterium]